MKTKSFKSKQIIKLYLLKTRVFDNLVNQQTNRAVNLSLSRILVNFKRTFSITYQFTKMKKRILFVGGPKELNSKINKQTQHVAVSENSNLQGIISNRVDRSSNPQCKSTFSIEDLFPKLKNKPDLVVLIGHPKQEVLIRECLMAKIPLIIFYSDQETKTSQGYGESKFMSRKSKMFVENERLLLLGLHSLFHNYEF